MEIRTVHALRFCVFVCAFCIVGITGCSGGNSEHNGNVIPLDNGNTNLIALNNKRGDTPAPLTPTVVATGLENPRGIEFGPDRQLYVAEGGLGGSRTTVGKCTQVPEVGPYSGGFTGRVSAVNVRTGVRATIVDHLPSSQTTAASGGFVSSVADVAFLHGE